MAKKKNNILQGLFLLLLLVILPFGSWYYMGAGHKYYKESMAELKDYGVLPNFALKAQGEEKPFDNSFLTGKMSVIAFINPQSASSPEVLKNLGLLHKQFNKRNDLYFLIHILSEQKMSEGFLKEMTEKYELTDDEQCYILTGEGNEIQNLVGTKYKVPDLKIEKAKEDLIPLSTNSIGTLKEYPYLILVDSKQVIRNYYNGDNKDEMKRLVEHISLILPKPVEEKPILKRVKEK